ncbi:MAG: phosphoribosylglycinamide formyltransferase [Planctomycetota bacterium]
MNGAPARLVVLASGGGRTLVNLQRAIEDGRLHAEIVVVIVSRADLKARERAQELGLATLVLGPQSHPDRAQRERLTIGAILEARPDLVVLAGWLQLLPIPAELEGKVLNIHPALLPAYGGKGYYGSRVHEAVVADGVPVSGCTVHFATSAYDEGPVLMQTAVPVLAEDDADALASRVFAAECATYPRALQHLIDGDAWWEDGVVHWRTEA